MFRPLLVSLVSIPLLAQVSRVAFTDSRDTVPAVSSSGGISLPTARMKIDADYPRGKKERLEMTVVYEPASGYYLWNIGRTGSNKPDGVRLKTMKEQKEVVQFVDATGLIQFFFGDGLGVKKWQGRAGSLDAAVTAATNDVREGLADAEGRGFHRDFKFIPIFGPLMGFDAKVPPGYKPIPRDFRCEELNSFCPSYNNRIASVSKQGANWRLVLRNRYDVEVIVDQNFDLVSAQQLTQPRK